jgi:zinc protease
MLVCAATARGEYAVVVSEATQREPAWRAVVQALVAKHQARVVIYRDDVTSTRADLVRRLPTHVAFVAAPQEAGRKFVVAIHQMMRQLDDDPYTDALWGIVTGYDAADALRIAQRREPLVIRSGGSGAGKGSVECLPQGFASYEGTKDKFWTWRDGKMTESSVKPDAAKSLADGLNTMTPEVFITSGHATERDWQIGYGFNGGQFRCERGQLYALNTEGKRFDIRSPTPKVYLPAGNCLIGHIPRADCMATAWMHSGGAYQMFGYTDVTWFGYMGWGTLDLFLSSRHNLAEAFFFNNQALVHKLLTEKPTGKDLKGLLYDRDIVAFYGDPAWDARMPRSDPAWTEHFTTADGKVTFTLTATRDGKWPGRPVCAWLPQRLPGAKVIAGQQHKPLVTDNFLLLPLTGDFKKAEQITVVVVATKP